ncbi:DUF92 domain-containing protein [Bacillus sp. Bva_UNVM-123]|uniref:DUF92 domain-containing protein n=1 Tax=Bacillus sp. Bva_UNVM-123 TaxID=2829798 RepID=UPI00391EE975
MISLLLLLFIVMISMGGYFFKLLTKSGSIAAFLIGVTVSYGFGIKGLLLLGFFFASSSFWSKFKRKAKMKMEERHEKGSQRDWQQVAANGGTAALFSLLNYTIPSPIWLIGFAIAIAAANSDTWASEIGSLSKRKPIFIRTLKRIESGTSGAVSSLGTVAAIIGALTIALLSYYFFRLTILEALIIFGLGFTGNLIDTVLGAFFQVVYQCKICGTEVESLNHCGTSTIKKRGLSIFNNDFVNFSSGFLAALFGMMLLK